MVKQGSDHTLRFDKLGYTPSTVSAVGRTRLIAAKQAVVDSAEALQTPGEGGGGQSRTEGGEATEVATPVPTSGEPRLPKG